MKILELCLSPYYGGLELHMRRFVEWLSTQTDIDPFIGVKENSQLHAALKGANYQAFHMDVKIDLFPVVGAIKLARFIQKYNIDLVHIHWKFDLPLAALAKRFSRKKFKLVHTRHMMLPHKKKDFYHKFLYYPVDLYLPVTKMIEREAIENLPITADRIRQIYLGIKPGEVPEKEELRKKLQLGDLFTVGLIGRVSKYKGQHLLLEALINLNNQGFNISAVIAGPTMEQTYMDELRQIVSSNQLGKVVKFIDFVENPFEIMKAVDTVVLATKDETFGLVLIEAMFVGTPVIGSDSGGVPEIIDHGETGLLFESWNSESLAEQIKLLVTEKDLRNKLSKAGQEKAVSQFNMDVQFPKILNEFRSLLVESDR